MKLTNTLRKRLQEITDSVPTHSTNRNRILKLALIKEFGICFYCDRPVYDYIPIKGEEPPFDTATIDHTISRNFRQKGERVLKVLSCYYCNQKRAIAEEKAIKRKTSITNYLPKSKPHS